MIRFALRKAGFATDEAADGRRALDCVEQQPPELVILDVLIPELDGLEVCKALRATSRVPILFLSSKAEEIDRILGLELGGDDYITKPFSPRELVARVRAVLRRARSLTAPGERENLLVHGPLKVDSDRFEACWDGTKVPLTVTELGLLRTLMGRVGKVFTRQELMDGAYRGHTVVAERTINSHIKELRRKLAKAGGRPIETVHGVGYRIAEELG